MSPGHAAKLNVRHGSPAWKSEARGEIRLDEIYARLGDRLDLDSEALDHLMRLETELELAQCARNPFHRHAL